MRRWNRFFPLLLVSAGDEELVVLAKFTHEFEAEASRAVLESAGIEAMIQHGEGVLAGMGITTALWISRGDEEEARRILAQESDRLELTPEEEAEDEEQVRRGKVARGARYLLVVAVAYLIFGTLQGLAFVGDIDRTLALVAGRRDGDQIVPGVTAGEFRNLAPAMKVATFVLVAAVSGAFLGLYFWARKSPIPALISGAVLFVVLQAAAALTLGSAFLGGSTGLKLGNLVWTVFFLAIWIVAIREARAGRRPAASNGP